jgi:hypothetical protein
MKLSERLPNRIKSSNFLIIFVFFLKNFFFKKFGSIEPNFRISYIQVMEMINLFQFDRTELLTKKHKNYQKSLVTVVRNKIELIRSNSVWFDSIWNSLYGYSETGYETGYSENFPIQFKFNIGCYFLFLDSIWLQTKIFSNWLNILEIVGQLGTFLDWYLIGI